MNVFVLTVKIWRFKTTLTDIRSSLQFSTYTAQPEWDILEVNLLKRSLVGPWHDCILVLQNKSNVLLFHISKAEQIKCLVWEREVGGWKHDVVRTLTEEPAPLRLT